MSAGLGACAVLQSMRFCHSLGTFIRLGSEKTLRTKLDMGIDLSMDSDREEGLEKSTPSSLTGLSMYIPKSRHHPAAWARSCSNISFSYRCDPSAGSWLYFELQCHTHTGTFRTYS